MIDVWDDLRRAQSRASDPGTSVWVSANAGSGKTHVLTQRVIRLLLRGTPPARILCLTFTKAAAAQMATRVFSTLAGWTTLDDTALRRAIEEAGAPAPDADDLRLARRLFTRTVETPGGLKIQTIHAFCERLLQLFPFEANVPARFAVLDDLRQAVLLTEAKRDAIAEAHRSTGALGVALSRIAEDVAGPAIDALIGEAMRARSSARVAQGPDAQGRLARLLGCEDRDVASIDRAILEDGIAPARWAAIADVLDTGSKSDAKAADKLRIACDAYTAHAADRVGAAPAVAAYRALFFTEKGTPAQRLMTASLATQRPDLLEAFRAEQGRLDGLDGERRAADALERTQALLAVADLALRRYSERKVLHGMLDFDDLIDRTRMLLSRCEAAWVLHKLDAGIDHVLVDEAQDTSEAQWRILDDLTAEFTSGLTARATERSFFAVGDDKQSIFSFQGAAPRKFHEMRMSFARRFRESRKPFEHVRLTTSFRSVPGVLSAVDAVFEPEAHKAGLVATGESWPAHHSIKTRLPGLVEIWRPIAPAAADEPDDWRIPVDAPDAQSPSAVLATRIAQAIAAMIAPGATDRVHEGRDAAPRPIRPGDVMILVRRRDAFFESMIRALKQAGVPVAGADRLDLANHIAVMDLVAAGRVALLPQDDLALACLLKSPLFGLDDADLIAIAPGRAGSLIDALAASSEPRYRDAHARIVGWHRHAADATPFVFYVELLGREGGRRQMEARLGPEAHDALDEFLRLALAHERDAAPSLHGFLADVEALDTTTKRDLEVEGATVRVMTVHAAKGLEAKVVFLPDTCGVPSVRHEPTLFNLMTDDAAAPVFAWSPRKDGDCAAVADAREAARRATMEEYRRLLYVALTRAEERLYIAGYHGARGADAQSWGRMIHDVLAAAASIAEVPAPWGAGDTVLRLVSPGVGEPATPLPASPAESVATAPNEPAWLFSGVPGDRAPERALQPSHARALERGPDGSAGGLAYGAALHGLLQHLPDVPPAQRRAAAERVLAAQHGFGSQVAERMVAEALDTLAMPSLAPLLSAGSRAEVAVVGRMTRPDGSIREVNGTIDRLAVTPEAVYVIDFKSGAPHRPDATPDAYLAQMGLYRAVLAPLWPDRPLRMAIVWTTGPHLVELDDAALTRAAAAALAAA